MCDQNAAVTALACSLIASVLLNLACLYWWCKEPPAPLPVVTETLGATLLNACDDDTVFARESELTAQTAEPQTGQQI